ncbi:cytochrome C biogenesis protein CcmA [Prosthecomicrobium hirschii]|uniref:Cytochrome C biogenesis protein CcmA n=1 Tax=Prosthecodimorpha hirschii TaxID=665126 RepID=A0A0P6VRE5_9HYPH|nr:heme ABC exporter ATP-binding protein CcmA [Prosthecomicrobium hirschii]KPL53752.1 cytochrome C biogenesis protein CcmA [Prosthecomicrobium hirschii]
MPAFPPLRLDARGLACQRGGRLVFHDLGFSVSGGEALVVTGPNGAGKSTLLRVIAGLVAASEGRIALEGGDADLSIAQQAHYFGHADALKPALTVEENLGFWRGFFGRPAATADAALAAVGIGHLAGLPAAYLSAGQRRRLSLARLLVSDRPIWLLDEPTSALDAASEARFTAIVAGHQRAGGIVVAATHQPLLFSAVRSLVLAPAGMAEEMAG